MELREAAALYALDLLGSDGLPDIAVDALASGYETPSLLLLAGATSGDLSYELRDWFEDALTELGFLPMERLPAVRFLIRLTARRVGEGRIPPREGAQEIVEELRCLVWKEAPDREFAGDGLGLSRLLGLYYAHDDVALGSGQTHEAIDEAIVEECRRLADDAADPDDTESGPVRP